MLIFNIIFSIITILATILMVCNIRQKFKAGVYYSKNIPSILSILRYPFYFICVISVNRIIDESNLSAVNMLIAYISLVALFVSIVALEFSSFNKQIQAEENEEENEKLKEELAYYKANEQLESEKNQAKSCAENNQDSEDFQQRMQGAFNELFQTGLKQKKKGKILMYILGSMILILIVLTLFMGFKISDLEDDFKISASKNSSSQVKIEELLKENEKSKSEISKFQSLYNFEKVKSSFLDEHIAFVVEGSNAYHTYSCEEFKGKDFFAYNKEMAEVKGYYPCHKCHD